MYNQISFNPNPCLQTPGNFTGFEPVAAVPLKIQVFQDVKIFDSKIVTDVWKDRTAFICGTKPPKNNAA